MKYLTSIVYRLFFFFRGDFNLKLVLVFVLKLLQKVYKLYKNTQIKESVIYSGQFFNNNLEQLNFIIIV